MATSEAVGLPIIVLQQPAQPLAAGDRARGLADFRARLDQLVAQPLMIALGVIGRLLADDVPQMRLAEHDEMIEALLRDGLHPAAALHGGGIVGKLASE